MKIEIDIEQQKHGELTLKYNGVNLGELNDLDPMDEINKLIDLIKVREMIMGSGELHDIINEEIEYRLVKLLAWFYTE